MPVSRSALVDEARAWDRPDRVVADAIQRGFVPHAADRVSLGKSSGVRGEYPNGSARSLRWFLRLESRGYRADALAFAHWWVGASVWTPAIRSHMFSIAKFMVDRLQEDLESVQTRRHTPSGETELGPDEWIVKTYLDGKQERLERVAAMAHEVGIPDASWVAIDTMLRYLAARVLGRPVRPEVLGAPSLPPSATKVLAKFVAADWLALYQQALEEAPRETFELARWLIRNELPTRPAIALVAHMTRCATTCEDGPRPTARQMRRLGALTHPGLATRALMLGVGVFVIRLWQHNPKLVQMIASL